MSAFPATRLRRLRRSGALRLLVRETRFDRADLVYPLFVGPESRANEELPALGRFSVDDLAREVPPPPPLSPPLRRPREPRERGAARAWTLLGRRPRPRGRGAARPRAVGGDPVRNPPGGGRGGRGRLRIRRHRPAGAPLSAGALPGSRPHHRCMPLRVHLARSLR